LGLLLVGAAHAFERQMIEIQGPETVFDRPVAEILPALAGATPTGENGRVGSALAFWGYVLADNRRAFFFGCAPLEDVPCEDRVQAICPATTTVLANEQTNGTIVRRSCRSVAIAGAGDLRPGCDDVTANAGLQVGLVSCG
jgi:hypothetical protein